MVRPLILLATLFAISTTAQAATLQGQIVNRTTGEPARADFVAVYDVTQSAATPVASLENVEGSFTLEGIPDAAAPHFRVLVRIGAMEFTQPVATFDEPMDVYVYDSTEEISEIALLRHHAIFTRDPEHIQVTEFFEFDNRTSPPRVILASALPMRLLLEHETHGAPTASMLGGANTIDMELTPTDVPGVLAVDRDLQPGPTRVIVRYLLHEENQALAWSTRSLFPTEERHLLVSPMDIAVVADGMISSEPAIEDYATWVGLASQAGDEWVVALSGGSAVAADDGHDHENESTTTTTGFAEIVSRPNRLTNSRGLILAGLGGLLLFGTLAILATGRRAAPVTVASQNDARVAVSKIADRYVSGEITREEYEREAARLLKKSASRTTPTG